MPVPCLVDSILHISGDCLLCLLASLPSIGRAPLGISAITRVTPGALDSLIFGRSQRKDAIERLRAHNFHPLLDSLAAKGEDEAALGTQFTAIPSPEKVFISPNSSLLEGRDFKVESSKSMSQVTLKSV